MQRYMYLETKFGKQGLFVPIDQPIEYLVEKSTNDSVFIKFMVGNYEYSFIEDRPAHVHKDDFYDWCKESITKMITWFLSSGLVVLNCTLLESSFTEKDPLEEFKILNASYLHE